MKKKKQSNDKGKVSLLSPRAFMRGQASQSLAERNTPIAQTYGLCNGNFAIASSFRQQSCPYSQVTDLVKIKDRIYLFARRKEATYAKTFFCADTKDYERKRKD